MIIDVLLAVLYAFLFVGIGFVIGFLFVSRKIINKLFWDDIDE